MTPAHPLRIPALLSLAALVLSGFGAASTPTPVDQAGAFSDKAVLTNVPFFKKQKDPNLCGVAVLEMLTLYYGQPLTPVKIQWLKDEAAQKKAITGATLEVVL